MSPPTPKEWWLAAALTGAAVPSALAQAGAPVTPAAGRQPTAQVTRNTPNGAVSTPIYVESAAGQKVVNDTTQPMHVLFSDQSAVTLAPNTEITIREYRFNSQTKEGNIVLDFARGLLRVVGGQISKNTPTRVVTATATIGVRGGITVAETDGQKTNAVFMFGQNMRATDNRGNEQFITRQGFGTSVAGDTPPTPPRRWSVNDMSNMLSQLERPQGGNPNTGRPPSGQLLSTSLGGGNSPGSSLANDRLKNVTDRNTASNASGTLKTLLGDLYKTQQQAGRSDGISHVQS